MLLKSSIESKNLYLDKSEYTNQTLGITNNASMKQ